MHFELTWPKGSSEILPSLGVVRPLTFSYFNLLLWNNWAKWNQTWQKASIKFLHFVPFCQQIWPPRAILVSDWLMFKMEPNLAGSIYVRSSIKLLRLVPFSQQTWPLLLKIEHVVKLHVFGNNSKTVNNIRNLTVVKMISTARSNYPEILKKIWLPILELLSFFHQIFIILILFILYFKNYKR